MEQKSNETNYYACIGLYDVIEAGISFNKNVYELTDEDIKHIKYMYCRNLEDGNIVVINQSFIKDTLTDPNTFIVNKYNGFYDPNEFYILCDLLSDIKSTESDELTIRNILSSVSLEFDQGAKIKTK